MDKNKETLQCDCTLIHKDIVDQMQANMPDQQLCEELAGEFRVFGDTTRIKILWALNGHELCVCDIAYLLDMSQSAISHQLRVLKQAKLVKSRKDGKNVFCSLADDHVKQILNMGLTHIQE